MVLTLGRRKVELTVDRLLGAWGKMMKNKAHGPGDCLVTEMLRELPMESQRTGSHTGLRKHSDENAELQQRGQFHGWYSSRSLMRSWRRESEGFEPSL